MEEKKTVKLGDGVPEKVKENINEHMTVALTLLSNIVFDYVIEKIKTLPEVMKEFPNYVKKLLSNIDVQEEIVTLWSNMLYEKGLIPKVYNDLSDESLIHNFLQTGYFEGLYTGYVLAMMALVDNNADNNLIVSVRDYLRPQLFEQSYSDRDEFCEKYKSERYSWVETVKRKTEQ